MNEPIAGARTGKRFAAWSAFLVCALYVPFFFLPVFDIEGPIRGWQGFVLVTHFPLPPLWVVALGHASLWVGVVLLATRRWRGAALAGTVGIALGLVAQSFLGVLYLGVAAKGASLVALTTAGLLGWHTFEARCSSSAYGPLRKRARPALVLLVGLAVAVAASSWAVPLPGTPCHLAVYADESRDALVLPDESTGAVRRVVYLDQGWAPRDSMDFYTRHQGSRLLPYPWFLALEQAGSEAPFRDPARMARLGYLPQKANACNPDGLPVGFVKGPKGRGERHDWLGLTCAACHTSEVHYEDVAFRIDGGPGMGDLQSLLLDLTAALKATLDDPEKFDRFARRVLRRGNSEGARADLRRQLEAAHRARRAYDELNHTQHPYGLARLDAFGRILNQVLVTFLGVDGPAQKAPPDAPVSYPFLWDTPHHDYVQWNAVARNRGLGNDAISALARNVGQVLGVFGEIDLSRPRDAAVVMGYPSSAHVPNLVHLESLLHKLQSPQWPAQLPPIDPVKKAAGAKLFDRYCVRCHAPIDRSDPGREVKAVKTPLAAIGTDPRMATNFATRRARTGPLEGRKALVAAGPRLGKEAGADDLLLHAVVGVLMNTQVKEYRQVRLAELRRRKGPAEKDRSLLVYRARPLNGIWATAPYLHNGSVPNLYQLLLPAEQRAKEFHVGSREFDPRHVGFRTEPTAGGFRFRTTDDHGRPIPGNSNAGHEYGTGKGRHEGGDELPAMSDKERWELLEYLKSL